MRADDFLTEGGLRSWIAKLGKDAYDYAASQAPKVKNYIDQPKGGTFGGRVPASPEDATHVYRNMSPEELEAARKSGYFEKNPNPGKTDWDTDKKYWSQGDTEGYFGRAWKDTPDNAQVRLPQEKLPRWTAGRTSDAEVLDKATGTWSPVKENTEHYNGIELSLKIQKDDEYVDDDDYDNQVVYVTASSNGRELGYVIFAFDGEYLLPQDLEVEERFRGQGIAQTMYDYVKSKGYKIRRSGQQTDAGAGFWAKHRPEQNVWEQGVAEGTEQNYLSQIPNLSWQPVSRSVWNTIQDEGLDEEQAAPEHTDWVMASLSISPKDARALQAFDNDAIEDFNRFDIHLKSRYPGLTDLIDYDRGTVTIVKPINIQDVTENFADGKVKGKSRPGRVKRAGASCNGSVTDLRARAKKASGERAKMYHWCANMKSGRNKK